MDERGCSVIAMKSIGTWLEPELIQNSVSFGISTEL